MVIAATECIDNDSNLSCTRTLRPLAALSIHPITLNKLHLQRAGCSGRLDAPP